MSNVDDRIVSMTFDNENFERRLSSTLDGLDRLAESLQFAGAADGFQAVSDAANDFDLSGMSEAVQNISDKFSALGAVAFSVIQNITDSVLNMVRSLPQDILGPILGGGKGRALNLEQARFLFEGLGADVEASMESARQAVLGTAYGLDSAAKAAAQLGGSGITAGDEMTGALRGIAGLAAMTNSSFEEMADIFTSAAGAGKISGMTLERISYRGLNAAAALAKQMGLTEAQVRDMASHGDIDFKTFAKAMNDAFGEHATEANKTYTGALSNLHAALSRFGAIVQSPALTQKRDVFNALTPQVDNLAAALKPLLNTFTALKQIGVTALIGKINALNFDNLKAVMPYISVGITNLFIGVTQVFDAIKTAFHDIFPKSSTDIIFKLTAAFVNFSEKIKFQEVGLKRLSLIFHALFTVIKVVGDIIITFAVGFYQLYQSVAPATDGLGNFVEHLVALVYWYGTILLQSGKIQESFTKLAEIIKDPKKALDLLKNAFEKFEDFIENLLAGSTLEDRLNNIKDAVEKVVGAIQGLFNKGEVGDTAGSIEVPLSRVQQRFEDLIAIPGRISDAWSDLHERFQRVFDILSSIGDAIKTFLGNLVGNIKDAFGPGSFDATADAINVGLLGAIAIFIKKFIDGGVLDSLTGGIGEKLDTIFEEFGNTLKSFQDKVKFENLKKIAESVAILTFSIVALSLIDSEALTKALVAIGVGFGELVATMKVMDKLDIATDSKKMLALGVTLNLMAGSMVILAGAIAILGNMDPTGLTRGLIGITTGMAVLGGAANLLANNEGGIFVASVALNAIAGALVVLAGAIALFGLMDWGTIGKGLATIAGALLIITAAMDGLDTSILGAIALTVVAGALNVLFLAVKEFGSLDWGEMGKGLLGLSGVLFILSVALDGMSASIVGAASIFIVAPALLLLAEVVKVFSTMDMAELGKGMLGLSGALLILTVALDGMTSALPGAVALLIVVPAIGLLVSILKDLGEVDFVTILKGLGIMSAMFAVIGIGANLLAPAIPAIAGLGAALALVGGAIALFGAGIFLLGKGFEALATSGVTGTQAFVDSLIILKDNAGLILNLASALILGFLEDFLNAIPLFAKLFTAAMSALLDSLIELTPKVGEAMVALIEQLFEILEAYEPRLIELGFNLIMDLLRGIRDNIGEVAEIAVDIIANLLVGLGNQAATLASGIHSFLLDVSKAVAYEIGKSSGDFYIIGVALVRGFIDGIKSAVAVIWEGITDFVGTIIDAFKSMLGISSPSTVFFDLAKDVITGFVNGLINFAFMIMDWFVNLPIQIFSWIGDLAGQFADKAIEAIGGFLWGLAQAEVDLMNWFLGLPWKIVDWLKDLPGSLISFGAKLIDGLLNGITGNLQKLKDWFLGLPGMLLGWLPNPLSILGDFGKSIVDGLTGGIDLHSTTDSPLADGVKRMADTVKETFGQRMKTSSPSKVMFEMGKFVVQGLVLGLGSMSSSIKSTTLAMADQINTVNKQVNLDPVHAALTRAVADLGNIGEFNPTITPVLDLSNIEKASKNIAGFMKTSSIAPEVSVGQANVISSLVDLGKLQIEASQTTPSEINYTQNNYSPEPLSTRDIYRKTGSQLALKKEELSIP